MKKVLVLSLVAAFAGSAFAQSFTEGFDTGPTGWIGGGVTNFGNSGATNMAFSSGTWVALNASAPVGSTGWFNNNGVFPTHSGAGQANANFNSTTGANAINSFLMSPVRTFNNGDVISFWTRTVTTPAFPDRLRLVFSSSGASTSAASFSTTLLSVNEGLTTAGYPNTWTQFTYVMTGLSGPTSGRFAFNYNVPNGGPSGTNSDFIGIDSVSYTAVPEPATMAALGLGALAVIRRRRAK
jgi:hypothetical protein